MKTTRLFWMAAVLLAGSVRAPAQDAISDLLQQHQRDLSTDGKAFLLKEASNASFFAVGGLHGDNETPALVESLWPGLREAGYRYIVGEMSPWAAARMNIAHVRGGDIEEARPDLLIRDLAAANPRNRSLQVMADAVKDGYQRKLAPTLLERAREIGVMTDAARGPIPLATLITRTLEVEVARLNADRQPASVLRETVMKDLFLRYYREGGTTSKMMAQYGQNHLGRGIDRRGVSTLGNFIAELAIAEHVRSFHVELFAAGGKIEYHGLADADQRKDELAFDMLASAARYPATVFDLRPLRSVLRQRRIDTLSAREASLLYSADAYDAMVCYREVTPAK